VADEKWFMSETIQYDAIVLGGGKGGKTLAIELGQKGVKTTLIERDAERNGRNIINPGADEELQSGDQILLLGSRSQLIAAITALK